MFSAFRSIFRIGGCVLATSGAALSAAAAATSAPVHSPQLQELVESYRLCIAINLPPDFRRVNDAESAAQVAAQKCADRRLQLAGRFALDNPGTRGTRAFIDGVTIQLVSELGSWLEDVNANRVSPNPAVRRTR